MSLSRQKKPSVKTVNKGPTKAKLFRCPECGAQALRRVRSNCKLLDGTLIRNLSRLHCSQCQEDFFDDAAMAEIRRQRNKKKSAKGQ